MSSFRFKHLHVENFRCFDTLDLALEEDVTVLFAENGGGKTALLNALAMGLAVIQRGSPKELKLSAVRDPRMVTLDDRGKREAVGPCTLSWTGDLAEPALVEWSTTVEPASGRIKKKHGPILNAIERTRLSGERWPLFASYGTGRLGRGRFRRESSPATADRWDGYASSLDPNLTDGQLLEWFTKEILSDAVRRREGQEERFLDAAVSMTMASAAEGVDRIWYEPRESAPTVRFNTGHVAPWSELSDGFHVFLALVGDIARRAVMLNEEDKGEAPKQVEGVVLIDELDLHLHPRWQRVALNGMRTAFPRLQFIITTHSPQVLSSCLNRQVRRLVDWKIQEEEAHVEGRDSNAILRDEMNTSDRNEEGKRRLRELHDAIDQGRQEDASRIYNALVELWTSADPALVRAKTLMDWKK